MNKTTSGVAVNEEVLKIYDLIKVKKSTKSAENVRPAFATFKLSEDKKEIIMDKTGKPRNESYKEEDILKDFKATLTERSTEINLPRYGLLDFVYLNKEQAERDRIVLFKWVPEDAPIKFKMIMASTWQGFKQNFSGCAFVDACDEEDLEYDQIKSKAEK